LKTHVVEIWRQCGLRQATQESSERTCAKFAVHQRPLSVLESFHRASVEIGRANLLSAAKKIVSRPLPSTVSEPERAGPGNRDNGIQQHAHRRLRETLFPVSRPGAGRDGAGRDALGSFTPSTAKISLPIGLASSHTSKTLRKIDVILVDGRKTRDRREVRRRVRRPRHAHHVLAAESFDLAAVGDVFAVREQISV
jgi:hypothetical protein